YRVVRQIQEERSGVVRVDELLRLARESIGEILARRGVIQPWNLSLAAHKRGEVAGRRARLIAGHAKVESLPCRLEALPAEVPLADLARGVAGRVQRLGQRH